MENGRGTGTEKIDTEWDKEIGHGQGIGKNNRGMGYKSGYGTGTGKKNRGIVEEETGQEMKLGHRKRKGNNDKETGNGTV